MTALAPSKIRPRELARRLDLLLDRDLTTEDILAHGDRAGLQIYPATSVLGEAQVIRLLIAGMPGVDREQVAARVMSGEGLSAEAGRGGRGQAGSCRSAAGAG